MSQSENRDIKSWRSETVILHPLSIKIRITFLVLSAENDHGGNLVRKKGLEPPRDYSHSPLKAACLPVSPLPHIYQNMKLTVPEELSLCKFFLAYFERENSPVIACQIEAKKFTIENQIVENHPAWFFFAASAAAFSF